MAPFTLRCLLSLASGLAGGVLADPTTSTFAHLSFAGGLMVAALAHANTLMRLREIAVWIAVASGAWIFGLHAIDEALHPSLRTMLEHHVGGFAIDSGAAEQLERPVIVDGVLQQDASLGASGVVMRITVEHLSLGPHPESVAGGVSVVVGGELAKQQLGEWTEGRRIRAPMSLRRPARYLNDGVPDLERGLARRGITLVGAIKSSALVEVIARGSPWQEWGARVRAHVRRSLAAHLSGGDGGAAAVATAILIGDRAALGIDVERRLQEAGTYHVLAISGGNIAILAGTVLGALALAGWRGRGAALVAIVALAAYALIVQGSASVARATSMALLYLGIRLIDQRTAPANALGLVVIGLLVVEPLAVTDVGLWLTAGATLGILLSAERPIAWEWTPARTVAALAMATVAAEIMLMPVSALTFQRVTLAGVGLNFIAIPCMTIVQLGSMCLIGVDALGWSHATDLAATVTEWAVAGLLRSSELLDHAPWLTWRVPPPRMATVATYYAALATWWIASRPLVDTLIRLWTIRISGALAIALFAWIAMHPPSLMRIHGDGRLHVTTVDVGQGDCTLVTLPNGRTLLVDTGGTSVRGEFDIGDRIVGPALRARGVRRLDYLAITHGDPDHIGGARALVRDFAPHEIWYGVPVPNHEPTRQLREAATPTRAAWRTLRRGDELDLGDVELHVLHPPPPDWERQKVRNDDSLVFELRFGEVSVLLTGDIGKETERQLLPTLTPLPRVILKVPHHGSGTSSSPPFVDALKPLVATIGVGRGNPYGHPVPQVLERYERAQTTVFRTDQDGEIDVVTDGSSIEVRTFTERRWSR